MNTDQTLQAYQNICSPNTRNKWFLTKYFEMPIGHRLIRHEGKCKYPHGHNFGCLVLISCNELNENNMVIDFHDLKTLFNQCISEEMDHAFMLNEFDPLVEHFKKFKLMISKGDPTAEYLSKYIYDTLSIQLSSMYPERNLRVDRIEIFENENSSAGYVG